MVHFGSKGTLRKVLCKYVDEETAANAVDAIGLSNKGCTVIDQQNGVFFCVDATETTKYGGLRFPRPRVASCGV